ncbi:MAG: hypothetical protein J7K72_04575, partial [Candidatus Aenigmarchaeota archaeon]|nr:hypothetical protein [Candidatus Aenigmarchaeota archaeon]
MNRYDMKAYVGAVGASRLTVILVMACILGVFFVSTFGAFAVTPVQTVSFLYEDSFAGVDNTTGFSTDDSMSNLGKSHLTILNGKGDVYAYKDHTDAVFTHRGTRGLGVYGGEDDEVDARRKNINGIESIEITFDHPYKLHYIEVRSLFIENSNKEEGDVDFYLGSSKVGSDHFIATQSGGNGVVTKDHSSNPIVVDRIKFYVNENKTYNNYSEFAVAKLQVEEGGCSYYTNENDCRGNEECDWCPKCNGPKINEQGAGFCYEKDQTGVCVYNTCSNECGAECETDCDCASYCENNVYYFGGFCQDDCTCGYTMEDCDDGITCTVDSCDPSSGCSHTPDNTLCDDSNPCTVDKCDPDDPNSDPNSGCVHTCQVNASCDDGNPETQNDKCKLVDGSCVCKGEYPCSHWTTQINCLNANCYWCNKCNDLFRNINYPNGNCVDSQDKCQWDGCEKDCNAECESNSDCPTHLTNDICYYSGSCDLQTTCTCQYTMEECPPSKVVDGVCYWERECDENGCSYNKQATMGCYDTCDPNAGPKDTDGPVTSNVKVNPEPPKYDPVTGKYLTHLTALETEDCTNIKAAEYFVRKNNPYCGPAGTGTPMNASDGAFDEKIEDVNATLAFGDDADGSYWVCVRGQNEEGVWGNCNCTPFGVDTIPPDCPENISMPELVCAGDVVNLTTRICDSESNIQAAKYYFDRNYNDGGFWMNPGDGQFEDDNCEDVWAVLNFSNLNDGCHKLEIHGKDTAENWGKFPPNFCSSSEKEFILDTTPPQTTKTVGTPKRECTNSEKQQLGIPVDEECYFITSSTQITLSAVDPNDPCNSDNVKIYYRVRYKVNSSDPWEEWSEWKEYTGPITFNEDSMHEIEYYAVDLCQNEENHHLEIDIVDNQPPQGIKLIGEPNITCDSDDCDYWVRDHVTPITLDCVDPE